MDLQLTAALALAALVSTAVTSDLKTRRISNLLVVTGIAMGLFFQSLGPAGSGLFAHPFGGLGLLPASLGALAGLALFLPLYAMRAMGAGDVKLLAMVGVWLGASGVAHAALWTLLAGGALALAVALWTGVLRQVLGNLRVMVNNSIVRAQLGIGFGVEPPARTTGRLPYAVAIACGTAFEVARSLAVVQ